jgi:hypothetical protein
MVTRLAMRCVKHIRINPSADLVVSDGSRRARK